MNSKELVTHSWVSKSLSTSPFTDGKNSLVRQIRLAGARFGLPYLWSERERELREQARLGLESKLFTCWLPNWENYMIMSFRSQLVLSEVLKESKVYWTNKRGCKAFRVAMTRSVGLSMSFVKVMMARQWRLSPHDIRGSPWHWYIGSNIGRK